LATEVSSKPKTPLNHNAQLAGFMHETHEIAGWTIIVAISLHIAGAIKHHFIDTLGLFPD
jgi:cytochrome b561